MSLPVNLQALLRQPYNQGIWITLLQDLSPGGSLQLLQSPAPIGVTHPQVTSIHQLGTLTLPDAEGESKDVALLEIETDDQVQLAGNRVGLRNFVARFIDAAGTTAVLAVFHQAGSPDWRLTYASRRIVLDEETFEISQVETAPRRFTFLLGPHEPCRTPAGRLDALARKGDALTLSDLEDAFSVERLSKEFFGTYVEHYRKFVDHLLGGDRAKTIRATFDVPVLDDPALDDPEAQERADKPVRDFVKRLLGRLVFLQFLQKKGWLGCPADSDDWTDGDPDFLRSFFQQSDDAGEADHFHSKYLTALFFEALNTERDGDVFPLTGTRLPYLNGGLFDPDPEAQQDLDFPADLFRDLLEFFAQYNFTIDENDPEDHEVGIDPEMLGHIFENLLEDNKDKGAYYTPKPVVAYMCQQSLRRYLESHLGEHEALTRLVEQSDPGDLKAKGNWCAANAKKIATLLEKVKICDPAIGSGAFPIGMLNEIVRLRTLLNAELNDPAERARLKKSIIQKSIYGVDLDSGAVDIARLRFWLALVVDEMEPQPLPNLDYKIMQGNSLLESFEGIDLSRLHTGQSAPEYRLSEVVTGQGELGLEDEAQSEFRVRSDENQSRILDARRSYFLARKPERKAELRARIDAEVLDHLRACLDFERDRADALLDQHDKIADGTFPKPKGWNARTAPRKRAALEARAEQLATSRERLEAIAGRPERPFFLWHLLFQDVFAEGGFDIVIANPPYVRQELIREQKPLLQGEGYTCYTGTADLFVYFYEQAVRLLEPGGVLTYISSNKYYRAGYGEKLRRFLTDHLTLHTLIDFRDAPVFNGVIAYASILIGRKEVAPDGHEVDALPWDQSKKAAELPLEIRNTFPVRQRSLTSDGWRLVAPEVEDLLAKLRENGTPLGEYVEGRFYYGIKTGLNEAFVIDGKKRAELIAADPNCEEIIKPFLRGRDVKRWKAIHQDFWLIKIASSANETHP